MRAPRRFSVPVSIAVPFVMMLMCTPAFASGRRAILPASGTQEAVEAVLHTDTATLEVRRCASSDCSGQGGTRSVFPIPIPSGRLEPKTALMEELRLGEQQRVLHVSVADRDREGVRFEAIVGGPSSEPLFAGLTGWTSGELGERSGQKVFLYDRDEATKFVVVADIREDTRICGQAETPLAPRGLDAKTFTWRGATLQRLDTSVRHHAIQVAAKTVSSEPRPLAELLSTPRASAPGASALLDASPETWWREQRPGDGRGEFVTMNAPTALELHALTITLPGAAAGQNLFAPRSLFLTTDRGVIHVEVPPPARDTRHATIEVTLPSPETTSCVSIVLGESHAPPGATPDVAIGEIAARTRFDIEGASLDDVVSALSGPRSSEATALLRRAGPKGLAAVAARWGSLDAASRAAGVDIAASAGDCREASMHVLATALADRDRDVHRRALGRIERCGKAGAEGLAEAIRSGDEALRATNAPILARISAETALDAIGAVLGQGKPETRRALRAALMRATLHAKRERLLPLFDAARSADARLDAVRALSPRLVELQPIASQALDALLRQATTMDTRYVLAEPLAALSQSPDGSRERERLEAMIRRDADWPVRMRAVEAAAAVMALRSSVIAALEDPEPRVRQAALRAIGGAKMSLAAESAATVLKNDAWSFVRSSAAEALGALPPNARSEAALAEALRDRSHTVRGSALAALGRLGARRRASDVRERLDDAEEVLEIRALAARTLGVLCERRALDRLTELALRLREPLDIVDETLGYAALEALGVLHPADIGTRLAPLRDASARAMVKRATERALAETAICR